MVVSPKDPPDMCEKYGFVYKGSCEVCGKVYICETGRSLEEGVEEHAKSLARGDEKSALSQHQVNSEHKMDSKPLIDQITRLRAQGL